MSRQQRPLRFFLPSLIGCCLLPAAVNAGDAPQPTGALSTVQGVRVLKLWGGARDQGYAHGYLLAPDIMALVRAAVSDPRMSSDPTAYERVVLKGFLPRMRLTGERRAELDGMFEGIVAALGSDATRIEALGRNLSRADLEALNTAADWYRLACSSFSAWGDESVDGGMITGRNLDFHAIPALQEKHLLVAYTEVPKGRKRWVSVAWPGLIGAYTAMNEDGVTISLHDAPGHATTSRGPFAPRTLALRDAIERAAANTAVADVAEVLRGAPAICGNNVHVSAPYIGQGSPAVVLEYDGDTRRDGGVTVRTASDADRPATTQYLLCTNHYRKRAAPIPCARYAKMERALAPLAASSTKVDVADAWRIMDGVSVERTLHTVVFIPNRRTLGVRFARPASAPPARAVTLNLDDLLARP